MAKVVSNRHRLTFVNVTAIGVHNRPIVIDFLPEDVVEDYSSSWGSETPLGRSNPIYIYAGGGDRSFSFSFDLHEDMVPDDDRFKSEVVSESRVEKRSVYSNGQYIGGREVVSPGGSKMMPDLRKFANYIQALSYPVRVGGVLRPPRIYLRIGDWFSGFGRIDTSVTWSQQRGGRFSMASFKFSFVCEVPLPLFVQDIIAGLHNDQSFRIFL